MCQAKGVGCRWGRWDDRDEGRCKGREEKKDRKEEVELRSRKGGLVVVRRRGVGGEVC